MADDIVGKMINFFSGDSTEHLSDKEIILRQRLKELGENKYSKFFRQKTEEADISLGQFFYSLYKIIMPARVFMKDIAKITKLRQIVLEAFMDQSIIELVKQLNPVKIEEQAKKTPPDELTAQIRRDIDKLSQGFDANRINGINRCYNLVVAVYQLVNFDYPALIKKFDPNFSDGLYGGDPKFAPVKAALIAKDLAEFLTVAQAISPDSDWKSLLKLLKICAGEELISESQFAQMLIGLRDIINSKILLLMVQYGSKNPVWICKPRIPDEHIAEAWMEARTIKAQECISKISTGEKHKQIDELLKDVFYGGDLNRLDYYTIARSEMLSKKELTCFAYAEGLNYLSVFLSEYIQKDMQELFDILLIRGQWTNINNSRELSEAFHQLQDIPENISQLDSSLSDEGTDGSRLKAGLVRIDRDRTQARYINSIVESVNETALEILNNAAQHLAIIDKHMKNLVDDVQKKHPDLIINWKELNSVSKEPLLQKMAEEHLRLNSFVRLMQLCAQ
ncbi:MAG: DUF5312 domain-containing protein [Treponema sp.]|nr:DUF5312 domain-containing protein [Treponema sp.]